MEEEFVVSVMVGKPAERCPGEGVKETVFPDEPADNYMIGCVSIPRKGDVALERTSNKQKNGDPEINGPVLFKVFSH